MADDDNNKIIDSLGRIFNSDSMKNGLEDVRNQLQSLATNIVKEDERPKQEDKTQLDEATEELSNTLKEFHELFPEASEEYEKNAEAFNLITKQVQKFLEIDKADQKVVKKAIDLQKSLNKAIKDTIIDFKSQTAQLASVGVGAGVSSIDIGAHTSIPAPLAPTISASPEGPSPKTVVVEAEEALIKADKVSGGGSSNAPANLNDLSGKLALDDYEKQLKEFHANATRKLVGISTMIFSGARFHQQLFKGTMKDVTVFRNEMRNVAYEIDGTTESTRGLQNEFSDLGRGIVAQTGAHLEKTQEAYLKNVKKGLLGQKQGVRNQKDGLKVIKSGMHLSTMIGADAAQTADMFGEWYRTLGLSSDQMSQLARDSKQVARSTGVTGDELVEAMKSSEGILKNLRNQGNLTNTAMANVIKGMAEAKKLGTGDSFNKIAEALSSTNKLFFETDDKTKAFLFKMAADMGKFDEIASGTFMNSRSNMKQMSGEMENMMIDMAQGLGADVKNFEDLNKLTATQRRDLAIQIKQTTGMEITEFERNALAFKKAGESLGDTLSGFDKVLNSSTSTVEERRKAEQDYNKAIQNSGISMLNSVSSQIQKTGVDINASLKELADSGQIDMNDFNADAAAIAATMGKNIDGMSDAEKIQMVGVASAERLQAAAKKQGIGVEDFSGQLRKAIAKGDEAGFRDIVAKMNEASEKVDVSEKKNIDPFDRLAQTIEELNEYMRKTVGTPIGWFVDTIGSLGLFLAGLGAELALLSFAFGGDKLTAGLMQLRDRIIENPQLIGTYISDALGTLTGSLSGFINNIGLYAADVGGALAKYSGPLLLAFGALKGAFEAEAAGRTTMEGSILGALTGGAATGSFASETLGIEKGSNTDKALGVAGGAAWGAAVGAGFSASVLGADLGITALVGALIGGGVELLKILTEGTTILADIISPFQDVFDGIYAIVEGVGGILMGLVTLDPARILNNIVGILGGAFTATVGAFYDIFARMIPGLASLLYRAVEAIFVTFPLWLGGQLLSGLEAVFVTFPTWLGGHLLSGLEAVFVTFPTWLGGQLLNGLQAVFVTFPTWLVGGLMSAIQAVFVSLPTWIGTQFMNAFNWVGSIGSWMQSGLTALSENEWIGPIFKPISEAFNIIGEAIMTIIDPIRGAFEGLYDVFVTIGNSILDAIRPIYDAFASLGEMFFGASEGGSALSGVMSVVQFAVRGLATVIGLLLQPVVWLAHAIGFVIRLVGSLVDGIIEPFRWLYDILVGHSIVPDLVEGIGSWFAKLPNLIFQSLLAVPRMIGSMFSNIGSYLEGFSSVPLIGPMIAQVGNLINFIGNAISILADGFGHVFGIIEGIFNFDADKVLDGIKGIGSVFMSSFANVGNFIYDSLVNAVSSFVSFVGLIPSLIGKAIGAIGSMITAIPSMVGNALSNIGSYLESFSSIPILGPMIAQVGNLINFIGNAISILADGFGHVFSILEGIFTFDGSKILEGIKGMGSAFIASFSNIGNFIYDSLVNAFSSFVDFIWSIPSLIGKVIGVIGSMITAIPSMIGGLFSNIGSYLESFGTDSIFGTIMSQIGNLYSFVGSTISNLVDGVMGLFTILQGIVTLDFGKIWEGITSIGSSIIAQFSNFGEFLYKGISNSIKYLFKSIKKIGGFFYRILTSALIDFPKWLLGKVMDVAYLFGNFLVSIPQILLNGFIKTFKSIGKFIWDVITWPFRKIWDGIKWMGEKLQAAWDYSYDAVMSLFDMGAWGEWLSGIGDAAYASLESIGSSIYSSIESAFAGFPGWLFEQMVSGISSIGSVIGEGLKSGIPMLILNMLGRFLLAESLKSAFIDFPVWLFEIITSGIGLIGPVIGEGLKSAFIDFPVWLFEQITSGIGSIGSVVMDGLKSAFVDLPTYIFDGFKSALQGIWDWIKGWIPGAKTVENTAAGYNETATEQAATMAKEGPSTAHAIGGLAGAGADLLQLDVGEAASKAGTALQEATFAAGENIKNAAESAWAGTKAIGSYLNPFNYFQEGTRRIEQPGLAMLHQGEMVLPQEVVKNIVAKGNGPFEQPKTDIKNKDQASLWSTIPGNKMSALPDGNFTLRADLMDFQSVAPAQTAAASQKLEIKLDPAQAATPKPIPQQSSFGPELTFASAGLGLASGLSKQSAIESSIEVASDLSALTDENLISAINKSFEFTKGLGSKIAGYAQNSFEFTKGLGSKIAGYADEGFNLVKSTGPKLAEYAGKGFDIVKSATPKLAEYAGKGFDIVKSATPKLAEYAGKGFNLVKSTGPKLAEYAGKRFDIVKSTGPKLAEYAGKGFDIVKSATPKLAEYAGKGFDIVKSTAPKLAEYASKGFDIVKSATPKLAEYAGKGFDIVKSATPKLAEYAGKGFDIVKSAGPKLAEYAGKGFDIVKSASPKLAEYAGKGFDIVKSTGPKLAEYAGKGFDIVKSASPKLAEYAGKGFDIVKSTGPKLAEYAGKGFDIVKSAGPKLAEYAGKGFDIVKSASPKLAEYAGKGFDIVKSAGPKLAEYAGKGFDIVKSVSPKLAEYAGKGFDIVKSAGPKLAEYAGKGFDIVKSTAPKLTEYAGKGFDIVKSTAPKLTEYAGKGFDIVKSTGPKLTEYAGKGFDIVKSTAPKLTEYAGKGFDIVKSTGPKLAEYAGKGFDIVKSTGPKLAEYAGKCFDIVKSTGPKLAEYAGKGFDIVKSTGPKLAEYAGKGFDIVKSAGPKLAEYASKGFDIVKSTGPKLAEYAGKGFDIVKSAGPKLAEYAGKGFDIVKSAGPKLAEYAGKGFDIVKSAGPKLAEYAGKGFDIVKSVGTTTLGKSAGVASGATTLGKGAGMASKASGLLGKASGMAGAVMNNPLVQKTVGRVLPFLSLVTGGVSGAMQAEETGRSTTEATILGAITGDAKTGSTMSKYLGVEEGSTTDKALGVGGAAATGALTGAAIGSFLLPGIGTAIGGALGGVLGGGAELYKWATEKKPEDSLQTQIPNQNQIETPISEAAKSLDDKMLLKTIGIDAKEALSLQSAFNSASVTQMPQIPQPPESIFEKLNYSIDSSLASRNLPLDGHAIPVARPSEVEAAPGVDATTNVQPVHLRDIGQTILRDKASANSGGGKLQSDELTRMEETAYKQVEELEQIREGINELVALMKPRGGGSNIAGDSNQLPGSTKDPRVPMHSAIFGKKKFGNPSGNANKAIINTGEV
jgi:phage-related protein